MRNIVSGIIALSLLLTMTTGCGNVEQSSNQSDESATAQSTALTNAANEKKVDSSESDSVSTTTQDTDSQTSSETDATSAVPAGKTAPSGDYEAALRELYAAMNQNDSEKMVRFMYPEKIVDCIHTFAEAGNSLANTFGMDTSGTTYTLTEIVEEGKMSEESLSQLMDNFDQIASMADLIETYGDQLQSMPAEKRTELYQSQMDTYSKSGSHPYTITEGYDVTVRSLRNGEPEEEYYYAYYIQGEGWKFDNSLRKYIRKSKQSAANANAKTLYVAFNTALVDLNAEGTNLSGACLISSDDSKNVQVPASVDVKAITKAVKESFNEADGYDYFALVNDGICVYAAVYKKDKTGFLGTYPISCLPKALKEHQLETENVTSLDKYTLDDLYQSAKNVIK